ncbi:MAG TPA: methionine--tRNA ligase [Fimbriimonadaceae bacterium]|nr:methionine--tRNA ligase [Fimbriimonadaceae bacterium]
MPKRTYVTTPIYYVNSVPHIGTTLTTVIADICTRYRALCGDEVAFTTGTDENGTKVMEAAIQKGKTPKEHTDEISQAFRDVFAAMNIQYTDFIRTTEDRHRVAVHQFFNILRDAGHVYLGKYEGWYDVSSETFYKETDLVDGKSPDGNEVRWVEEENWFFRLSAFEEQLLAKIASDPKFLLPETRKNEVVSFIKQGLRDMCITRKNPGWGITVPGDDSRIFYVWFDALISYLASTGWPGEGWENTWPADVHWMAKEIYTRFHATLWPAMLMGAGLPLPKSIIAHGWFTFGDAKMSKSKGNIIAPLELAEEIIAKTGCDHEVAIDAVRFVLARLLPAEGDTNFTRAEVDKHYNADLANDLGNALNRSLSMAHKFAEGKIPTGSVEPAMTAAIERAKADYASAMDVLRVDKAVDAACELVRFLNKYIDDRAPWALAKSGDTSLPDVLLSMLASLRTSEQLIRPIMPTVADRIAAQLNLPAQTDFADASLPAGTELGEPKPIFPRIDPKKAQELTVMETTPTTPPPAPVAAESNFITIEDFAKVQLKVARVLEAEPIEGSDKLLKLQVVIGEERRQVVAGIKANYAPIDLVGRQVIIVYNLKPAKLRGVESQGMLLAATDADGGAILLQPDREAPEGTGVK